MTIKKAVPYILIIACICVVIYMFFYSDNKDVYRENDSDKSEVAKSTFLFGICVDSLEVTTQEIERGETFGVILSRYNVSPQTVHNIGLKSDGVFDLRLFREGNKYNIISDSTKNIQYFIYEHSIKEYITIDFTKEEISIEKHEKEVEVRRSYGEAVITSSLWGAAIDAGMNGVLAMNLSDVYQWSVDFYGIQKGDKFSVLYDELYIDGKSIGVGSIWGACFTHNNKEFYAVRYEYKDKGIVESGYWDEVGKSLKSAFLKAPLKYSRISSKFSHSRMHPILRYRRPHLGVDYAAPTGTPVQSISNGVITSRGYAGGGGHTVKIRHARGYSSAYLHLSRYGKGIKRGATVRQGQIIGYVGSTGLSTGPHLDFRIYKNGKAIDPLRMVGEKGEDIKKSQKDSYNVVKDRILKELNGKVPSVSNKSSMIPDSIALRMITVPMK